MQTGSEGMRIESDRIDMISILLILSVYILFKGRSFYETIIV